MQFLDGETLRGRDASRCLAAAIACSSIATQIGDALAAAHARGIVHRDVKPGNVIAHPRWSCPGARLRCREAPRADARRRVGSRTATLSGMIVGTPAYLSPEAARGAPVDHRTDVFSFGIVLYEMATGRSAIWRADER